MILDGDLVEPPGAAGVVVFAHGSGGSRHSPRNRMVAARLQAAGYATLLMDLLTSEEEHIDDRTRKFRFDIPRLASRLVGAIRWLRDRPDSPAAGGAVRRQHRGSGCSDGRRRGSRSCSAGDLSRGAAGSRRSALEQVARCASSSMVVATVLALNKAAAAR